VTCFFVARPYRRSGLSVELLRGAVKLARSKGARIVEGYPTEARGKRSADVFVFTGLASSYLAAGFHEVARRSPARPIMRRAIR
jgi:GNAT superfamily N-acetyltransferase